MEHLPPVGWADVATKRDLDHLKTELSARIETTEQRLLATFRAELNASTRMMISNSRNMIFGLTAAYVGVAGVTLAVAQLI